MTKTLEDAIEAVRKASPGKQDAVAKLIIDMLDRDRPDDLSADELADVLEAEAQIERGEFVEGTPASLVAAAFSRNQA